MPTKKKISVTKSRTVPAKTIRKKKNTSFSFKKLLSFKIFLVLFALIFLFVVSGVFLMKKNNIALDTLPTDSNSTGGAYRFDEILNKGCDKYADTDSRKAPCYEASLRINKYAAFPNGQSADTFYSNIASNVIQKYITMYETTNYGSWRSIAAGDNHYFRTVCMNAVVRSVYYKKGGPRANTTSELDRVKSVWNDFDYIAGTSQPGWGNPSNPGFWLSSAVGIPCLTAASMVWGDTNMDYATRASIRDKAGRLATSIYNLYNTNVMKSQNKAGYASNVGDSKGEEAVSHGAYLTMYSTLANDWRFNAEDQRLIDFAGSACADPANCALMANYTMPNHNMWPNPQYAYSVLQYAFYAGLPIYLFNNNNPEAIFPATRLLGFNKSKVYNPYNILESNARLTIFSNGAHCGPFTSNGITYNYCNDKYLNQYGVNDWGFSAFNRTGALAFMYMINPSNSMGMRSYDSPYAWHMNYENNALSWGTFIYSDYKNGAWTFDTLPAAKAAYASAPLKLNGNKSYPRFVETGLSTDGKINLNFFQNSIQAFDHALVYMYHMRTTSYLKTLSVY